jgi:hypothetical protein
MRRALLALGAFLAALVVGWMGVVGVYILGTSLGWFFDRDGGGAMGALFMLGPAVGLLLGVMSALAVAVRGGRSRQG